MQAHPDAQWMIRTAQNKIQGPYSIDEIRGFIQSGKLTTLDEVCPSGSYWFFLHEAGEVKNLLGVDPPKPLHDADDDVTETEVSTQGQPSTKPKPGTESLADNEEEETTGVVPQSKPRASTLEKTPYHESAASDALEQALQRSQSIDQTGPRWVGKVEALSFWKGFTVFLSILGVVIFLSILRMIKHPH